MKNINFKFGTSTYIYRDIRLISALRPYQCIHKYNIKQKKITGLLHTGNLSFNIYSSHLIISLGHTAYITYIFLFTKSSPLLHSPLLQSFSFSIRFSIFSVVFLAAVDVFGRSQGHLVKARRHPHMSHLFTI